jgi:hypothetical protein
MTQNTKLSCSDFTAAAGPRYPPLLSVIHPPNTTPAVGAVALPATKTKPTVATDALRRCTQYGVILQSKVFSEV